MKKQGGRASLTILVLLTTDKVILLTNKHPKAAGAFLDFKHANDVREKAKGKDAHPLIIYINLESKKDLDYDTMMEFSNALGSESTLLPTTPHLPTLFVFPGCEEGTGRVGTHTKTNGVACMIRHGGGGRATVKGSVERVGVHKRACNGKAGRRGTQKKRRLGFVIRYTKKEIEAHLETCNQKPVQKTQMSQSPLHFTLRQENEKCGHGTVHCCSRFRKLKAGVL